MVDLLRCALPPSPDPALAEAALRPKILHAAADALAEARARPSHATMVLSRRFREDRRLGSKERPVAAEAAYGVIRHEGLLGRAGCRNDEARVAGWARLIAGDRLPDQESRGPVVDYATALSLPEAVAGEWLSRLGPEEAALLGAALAGRAPLVIRANRARTSREALAARLEAEGVRTEAVPGAPDALRLLDRVNVQGLPQFRAGLLEVQDTSSQRLVEALLPFLDELGPRVLDLCAGAGGKTLALAARGASVRAFDPRSHALDELDLRARRAGLRDRVSIGPPRPAPVVLVDAPCTGTGRLRRDPALRLGLRPDAHLEAQRAVLGQGAALVPPGGILAYATCSMLQAENAHDPGEGWTLLQAVALWPHRDDTDGFAWRIWRRRG